MTQLDPQARSLLEAMKASGQPPLFTLPVPDARRARRRQLVVHPPGVQIATVEDDLVPGPAGGIPVRWYRPSPEGELPVALYFHGGGWAVACRRSQRPARGADRHRGVRPASGRGTRVCAASPRGGVAVEDIHLDDQMHAFLLQEAIVDRARQAVDHFDDALRRGLT